MDWTYLLNQKLNAVEVKISGDRSVADSIEMVKVVTDFAKEKTTSKFLFDLRNASGQYEIIDIYEHLNNVLHYGFRRNDKLALVGNEEVSKPAFAENVAYNGGIIILRYFKEIENAEEWLLEENN